MSHDLEDTIAAAASAPDGAARGVIRLSGSDVGACIAGLFRRRDDGADWRSAAQAVAVTGDLLLGRPFAPLPCDLYYWPSERSYTRQPAAELHTIGSPPLLDAALRAVCAAGARLAEPGEFTMRAFLAGRLDLTQAEAVLGAIDAADRRQFDVALAQLAGGMSRPLARLRDNLLDMLAHLEAGLDFAEEDIQFISAAEIDERLGRAEDEVRRLAEQTRVRGETGEAFRVALVGWPNVGKSSLFNALAPGADALVCDVPGTTRDYLTARVQFDGVACQLIDTAGVEPDCTVATDRAVAASAQEMTNYWRERADLQVLCLDATRPPNAWEQSQLSPPDFKDRLVAMTKCDRDARELPSSFANEWGTAAVHTSALTGEGVEALRRAIAEQSRPSSHAESSVVAATAVRCHESLRLAAECLHRARQLASNVEGDELVAVEIHGALDELGKVAGAVFTDDILDRIFSRFCIGK